MTAPAPAASPPPPATWRQRLEEQDQVLSRRQARLGGLSEDQWQWRLDSGRWQAVLPGVAVAHSGAPTDRQRARAAVLFAGRDGALSADAALVEWGMRLPSPDVIHITIPEKRRVVDVVQGGDAGVRVEAHRVRGLSQLVHPAHQPPVVRVAPAVLHAAAWATTDRAAEWRLAAAVQQRLARPADLRQALAQMPRLHRCKLLRLVLDDVEHGAHAASEIAFLRLLRRHRLPLPDRLQRPVRSGRVRYLDAWWERQRVTAEIDGAHHRLVGTWDDDALRGNDVAIAERHDRVLLLRLTTGSLRHDEPRVAAQLQLALA